MMQTVVAMYVRDRGIGVRYTREGKGVRLKM